MSTLVTLTQGGKEKGKGKEKKKGEGKRKK